MINSALVQKNPSTGEFIDPNVYTAWYGLDKLGIDTTPFTWPDLRDENVPLARDVVVVGGILTVRTALERLGRPAPENVDYPDALRPFFRREVRRATLGELRGKLWDDGLESPLFVKPVTGHKDFDGHVVSRFRDLIRTAGFPSEMAVWLSEVTPFVSEHRCFVRRGSVVGVRHYAGDPLVFPARSTVVDMVEAYEAAPVAYTLDVGVRRDGATALVEVNDGFSAGCYGLRPDLYAKFLVDRWCELADVPLMLW